MHPTVKPVALIADAIKDASRRSNIVLDPFCGSGSTLIAAEKTGRRGHAIEIDPQYVDVAVRRWQRHSAKPARLDGSNATFEEIAEQRSIGSANLNLDVQSLGSTPRDGPSNLAAVILF